MTHFALIVAINQHFFNFFKKFLSSFQASQKSFFYLFHFQSSVKLFKAYLNLFPVLVIPLLHFSKEYPARITYARPRLGQPWALIYRPWMVQPRKNRAAQEGSDSLQRHQLFPDQQRKKGTMLVATTAKVVAVWKNR